MFSESYIVDLGLSMFDCNSTLLIEEKHKNKQLLKCLCGAETIFDKKVSRSVVLFTSGALEDGKGISKISCKSCGLEYPKTEKPHLLKPGKEKLIQISYSTSVFQAANGDKTYKLIRERKYVIYKNKFSSETVYDNILFNDSNNEGHIFIDNTKFADEQYILSAIKWDKTLPAARDSVSHPLDISNLITINKFFGYRESIKYNGLEEAFSFFKNLDFKIKDIDKIKEIPIIKLLYNYELKDVEEINPRTGQAQKVKYQVMDSGFGDGTVELVTFHAGSFLESITEMARIFFSIMSFPNITTVLLTKGYQFYEEFLKSEIICSAAAYRVNSATKPAKILEISLNCTKSGRQKLGTTECDGAYSFDPASYLKISDILFKSIRRPEDLLKLLNFYNCKYIKKSQLEYLFLSYPVDDVYELLGVFSQHNHARAIITNEHIRHAIRHKIYRTYFNDRFWSDYTDTINAITQIIESKNKVLEFIEKHKGNLSIEEKRSFKKYLQVKDSIIFTAKTARKLKTLHDEMSSLHAIFQDSEKAEAYKKSIFGLDKILNQEVNDVTFTVIPSAHEMHIEHTVMSHCVQVYMDRVISGEYAVIRVRDTVSKERATLGLTRSNSGQEFTFNQLKGYDNSRATKFLIDTVLEYCKIFSIKLENSNFFSVDLQSDKTKEIKMPDYLCDGDVALIRKVKLESRITAENSPLNQNIANSIIEKFIKETSNN